MGQMVKESLYKDFYSGRKVFITGHTGFKGSWLSILLHWLGADIYGYALNPHTTPSLFKIAGVDRIITSVIGDIRDFNFLLKTLQQVQPEVIIHLAAQPLVKESYRNPRETYEVNVMGIVNLLDAARQIKSVKTILNVTTDKCYENKEWTWGYRENDTMGGYDPYSNSKGCSELITSAFRSSFFNPKEYKNHGVALASARAGNVIGGGDWADDRLIPDFIRSIVLGQKLKIRSPFAIRPWQHVLEPLSGYLILCEKLYSGGPEFAEAWNFGPNDSDSKNVEWITQRICQQWGNGASYELDRNPQPHETNYLKLDCSKAKTLLKWDTRWNIETALDMIVDWHKSFLNEGDMRKITIHQIETYFNSVIRK
jgi:CDP-glucose 4,6-dehydratase